MEVTVDLKTIINKLQVAFDKIKNLEEQNKKLRECIEFYADYRNDNPDNDYNNDYAIRVLKEICGL